METCRSTSHLAPPPSTVRSRAPQRIVVDERVVQKVLEMNPSLRRGRSTQQIKEALERGERLTGDTGQRCDGPTDRGGALAHAIDAFIANKRQELAARVQTLEAERRALEVAEATERAKVKGEVLSFLSLLDGPLVSQFGGAALSRHADFLRSLGFNLAPTATRGAPVRG